MLDGTLIEKDSKVASSLNDYFCSVYTKENLSFIPTPSPRLHDDLLSDITVAHEEVFHQLCKLHPHKSRGPDQCHPYILTRTHTSFSSHVIEVKVLRINEFNTEGYFYVYFQHYFPQEQQT